MNGTQKLFGHCYVKASEYTTRQKNILRKTRRKCVFWRKKNTNTWVKANPLYYGSIKEWL